MDRQTLPTKREIEMIDIIDVAEKLVVCIVTILIGGGVATVFLIIGNNADRNKRSR